MKAATAERHLLHQGEATGVAGMTHACDLLWAAQPGGVCLHAHHLWRFNFFVVLDDDSAWIGGSWMWLPPVHLD